MPQHMRMQYPVKAPCERDIRVVRSDHPDVAMTSWIRRNPPLSWRLHQVDTHASMRDSDAYRASLASRQAPSERDIPMVRSDHPNVAMLDCGRRPEAHQDEISNGGSCISHR